MKANLNVYLPPPLLERVETAARQEDRSRSGFVRRLLEQALTGQDRREALEKIAADGLDEYAAKHTRVRGPNPGEVIAESSTDGHRRIEAMQKIAGGGK